MSMISQHGSTGSPSSSSSLTMSQSSSQTSSSTAVSRTSVTGTRTTTVTSSTYLNEFTGQKVVSIVYSNGTIGASFYTQEVLEVRMLPQLPDQGCILAHLEQLLLKLLPTTILISRTAHRDLENSVKAFVSMNKSTRTEKVPPQQMSLATAKQELLSLNLRTESTSFLECSEEEKMIYLNSILDFSQEYSLRSLGALLQFVKTQSQCSDNVVVVSLGMHRGCGHLTLSSRTLRDLHILCEEPHPCSLQGDARRSREGMSVFSLFERNCTIGRTRLKSLFTAPYNDEEKIRESLESVSYLVSCELMTNELRRAVSKVRRIDRIIVNMSQGQTTVPEWHTLRDVIHDLLVIQELLGKATNSMACVVLERARESSCAEISVILDTIDKTIDFEAYYENPSYSSPVKEGICAYLDEKKRQLFGNIHKKLSQLSFTEMENMPAEVSDGRIIYLPCWGFVFATTPRNEAAVKRLQFAELVCKLNTEVLFKTPNTRELDREYGDLRNIIIHRENKICRVLQEEVLERSWQLLEMIDKLCDFDASLALAITARERGFTSPKITNKNIIAIKNGFHPLLGMNKLSGVVHVRPNSFLSSESVPITVVTGANSCGKSVYLRQTALIVFLAHVGSLVPAEESRIGLLDTIQTSFFIDETMQDQTSSFALQCRQIASIERSVENSRALVVIDEFGKGTNTTEGAGLCVALLEKFISLSTHPHVLFASHYYKHLHHFLKNRPQVQFVTFRYVMEGNNLVQLHEVVEGIARRSFGSFAAKEADLPQEIVTIQEKLSASLETPENVSLARPVSHGEFFEYLRKAYQDSAAMVSTWQSNAL